MKQDLTPRELNLDRDETLLSPQEARWLKNLQLDREGEGGVLTHSPANERYAPALQLPEGRNRLVGRYRHDAGGRLYCFIFNERGAHTIYRLGGGAAEVVARGAWLTLSEAPEHFVGEGRCHVEVLPSGRTLLLYLDAEGRQRLLCVEDAVGSAFFTHPYFAGADLRLLTSLGVPTPMEPVTFTTTYDPAGGINRLKKQAWRFRLQYIDVYGRPSEWGVISEPWYAGDCAGDEANCLTLSFPAGGPLVDKINLAYQRTPTEEWKIFKTIDKWAGCAEPWWTRPLNEDLTLSDHRLSLKFCGPGECRPVADSDTSRTENPLPVASQALFPLGGYLGLGGNDYGRGPLDCATLDTVDFTLETPTATSGTGAAMRTVTVWLWVWNPFREVTQALWTREHQTVFGGIYGGSEEEAVATTYGQHFSEGGAEGFIGYFAGTQTATVSKQYRVKDPRYGPYTEYGVCKNHDDVTGYAYLQRFQFAAVAPGKYIFRVASHLASLSGDYQRTSSYVAGQAKAAYNAAGGVEAAYAVVDESRELLIDCSEKDYDSIAEGRVLLLYDLTWPKGDNDTSRRSHVVEGYVYEENASGVGVRPVEGARVDWLHVGIGRGPKTTDHNGYYWVAARDRDWAAVVQVRAGCSAWKDVVRRNAGGTPSRDVATTYVKDALPLFVEGKENRVLITGSVKDCQTGAPMRGVVVGVEQGPFTVSAEDGSFQLVAHDFYGTTPRRRLVYLAQSTCPITTCEGSRSLPTVEVSWPACSVGVERRFTAPALGLKVSATYLRGLQMGGRYATGFSLSDDLGRESFVQYQSHWYFDIPTPPETGSFVPSRIRWRVEGTFPLWVRRLHLRCSQNLAFSDFLTWAVDRVELVDAAGLKNEVTPTHLRIYYGSLSEYNKLNGYATSATWQILDENDALETQDTVQFLANGDGTLFREVLTEKIGYDKDGQYFTVPFSEKLRNLRAGALFKWMRPAVCTASEQLYEYAHTVEVVDGVPRQRSGYLDLFDAYTVYRSVPVPVTTVKKVSQAVAGTSNPVVYETVETATTQNEVRAYAWPFEHHAPSDFWGEGVTSRGRPNVKNPYEAVRHHLDELALSGAIGQGGALTYLHWFSGARKKSLGVHQSMGPVTTVVPVDRQLLVVGAHQWCTVPFDDNALRATASGAVQLLTSEGELGKPQLHVGSGYGLAPGDRATLSVEGGVAVWLDRVRVALVRTTMTEAVDVARGVFASYLRGKLFDASVARRWSGQFSPKGGYYLTDHVDAFTNAGDALDYALGDTLVVEVLTPTPALRRVLGCVPEGWAALRGDAGDEQLFSFAQGLPWAHHRPTPLGYNNFYGTDCPPVVELVVAAGPLQEKGFLGLELFAQEKWWAPLVVTSAGQRSRIPPNWWLRGDRHWRAPFLMDEATPVETALGTEVTQNVLFGGDTLRGRSLRLRLRGTTGPGRLEGVSIYLNLKP